RLRNNPERTAILWESISRISAGSTICRETHKFDSMSTVREKLTVLYRKTILPAGLVPTFLCCSPYYPLMDSNPAIRGIRLNRFEFPHFVEMILTKLRGSK